MKKTIFSQVLTSKKWENVQRNWYKFSRNRLSIIGLLVVFIILSLAIFAPLITVHPEAVSKYVNFSEANQPPSLSYPFGTDVYGRDIFTRTRNDRSELRCPFPRQLAWAQTFLC